VCSRVEEESEIKLDARKTLGELFEQCFQVRGVALSVTLIDYVFYHMMHAYGACFLSIRTENCVFGFLLRNCLTVFMYR